MEVPFSPPHIDQKVIESVNESLRSGWITTGPKVKRLEELVTKYTNAPNCLCVNSATSGLMLAMSWFGIGKGDEVIIPAYTYAATGLAVMHIGAVPVMVDVNEDFNLDCDAVSNAITEKTKAIIPVDIAGFPCDYDELFNIVEAKKAIFKANNDIQQKLGRILLLSDAAHSIGATYKGKNSGALSDISVFSFHAVKNVTTAEGGAVCLNLPSPFDNAKIYSFLRCISLNGQTKDAFTKSKAGSWRYDIIYPGFKINLPDVLAAIAVAQLPVYFESMLDKRKAIFKMYNNTFKNKPWAILPPSETNYKSSSCHIYALRLKDCSEEKRDKIIDAIAKNKVAVNVHFQPLPMLTVFKDYGFDINNFPKAYNQYCNEISLPIYTTLKDDQISFVLEKVIDAVESNL